MRLLTPCLALLAMSSTAAAAGSPSLDQLIKEFQSEAPKVEAEVRIDAWVDEADAPGQPDEIVITLLPEGQTKLNADPGITVTPADQPGVDWAVPTPYRHQDTSITYFEPPATIRLPFTASENRPVDILVEYAYCLVDYQCFFGEETLRVDLPAKAKAS
ncbi:MAG: hypothetical protein R3F54_29460 [Alphaproteobacteria bacterium]